MWCIVAMEHFASVASEKIFDHILLQNYDKRYRYRYRYRTETLPKITLIDSPVDFDRKTK